MIHSLPLSDLTSGALIFTRMIAFLSFTPGFSDHAVNPRIRILLALLLAYLTAPVISPLLPKTSWEGDTFLFLLGIEFAIGFFMALLIKLLFLGLDTAGTLIGMQMSLSNALGANPTSGSQVPLPGTFLGLTVMVLMFTLDLHHYFLKNLVDSYTVFQPGVLPPLQDMGESILGVIAYTFKLAIQISAPFIIGGLLISLAMGLINRLMPQVQIFFIMMPLQILLGLILFTMTLKPMIEAFMKGFDNLLRITQ